RSRRDRAGRRDVQRAAAVRQRAEAVDALGLLRPRRYPARAPPLRRLERRAGRGLAQRRLVWPAGQRTLQERFELAHFAFGKAPPKAPLHGFRTCLQVRIEGFSLVGDLEV